jgi:hypothetical protein
MRIPGSEKGPRKPADDFVAAEDAGRMAERATTALERAAGVDWYDENGTAVDEAALALALLRRAQAGLKGGPRYGDDAVRRVLEQADPQVVVWLASRAVSYMDETGYPEAVEAWFPSIRELRSES